MHGGSSPVCAETRLSCTFSVQSMDPTLEGCDYFQHCQSLQARYLADNGGLAFTVLILHYGV